MKIIYNEIMYNEIIYTEIMYKDIMYNKSPRKSTCSAACKLYIIKSMLECLRDITVSLNSYVATSQSPFSQAITGS